MSMIFAQEIKNKNRILLFQYNFYGFLFYAIYYEFISDQNQVQVINLVEVV